jgi:hypothetical protein
MLPVSQDYTSRAGTLLHELTHFNDDYATGTDDNDIYSYAAAAALAISARSTAVRTARNYELFYVNFDGE